MRLTYWLYVFIIILAVSVWVTIGLLFSADPCLIIFIIMIQIIFIIINYLIYGRSWMKFWDKEYKKFYKKEK